MQKVRRGVWRWGDEGKKQGRHVHAFVLFRFRAERRELQRVVGDPPAAAISRVRSRASRAYERSDALFETARARAVTYPARVWLAQDPSSVVKPSHACHADNWRAGGRGGLLSPRSWLGALSNQSEPSLRRSPSRSRLPASRKASVRRTRPTAPPPRQRTSCPRRVAHARARQSACLRLHRRVG